MRSAIRVLLLASLVVACSDAGSDASDSQSATDSTAAPAPPAEPVTPYGWMPEAEDSSRPAGTFGAADQDHRVVAVLTEWGIELSPETIPAGEVTIALENRGERPHTIEVRNARSGRWRSMPIPPGGTVTMSMPLPPANFEVVSTTEAYVERGMRALLLVR